MLSGSSAHQTTRANAEWILWQMLLNVNSHPSVLRIRTMWMVTLKQHAYLSLPLSLLWPSSWQTSTTLLPLKDCPFFFCPCLPPASAKYILDRSRQAHSTCAPTYHASPALDKQSMHSSLTKQHGWTKLCVCRTRQDGADISSHSLLSEQEGFSAAPGFGMLPAVRQVALVLFLLAFSWDAFVVLFSRRWGAELFPSLPFTLPNFLLCSFDSSSAVWGSVCSGLDAVNFVHPGLTGHTNLSSTWSGPVPVSLLPLLPLSLSVPCFLSLFPSLHCPL